MTEQSPGDDTGGSLRSDREPGHHALMENLNWRKSRASYNGNCVEVAARDGMVYVRDTKAGGTGAVLTFDAQEWTNFLAEAQAGGFALPEA
jgi:Domain of unknown function (DUF397)